MMPDAPQPPPNRRALMQRLESLRAAGVEQLPRALPVERAPQQEQPPLPTASVIQPATGSAGERAEGSSLGALPGDSRRQLSETADAGDRLSPHAEQTPSETVSEAPTLEVLQQEVAACTRCSDLASTRTQTVFGVGNPNARLVFLGEAPGADEDRTGEPFVGRAGQLLNKIIKACTLRREEVYILNILKCRPPGNRNPTPDESASCKHFLRRQLDLIRPESICCLGAVAAQNLLETPESIGRLRGRVHDYRGIKVICTYHPAYLLRTPSAKRDTWEDMQMLMRLMGIELPR